MEKDPSAVFNGLFDGSIKDPVTQKEKKSVQASRMNNYQEHFSYYCPRGNLLLLLIENSFYNNKVLRLTVSLLRFDTSIMDVLTSIKFCILIFRYTIRPYR